MPTTDPTPIPAEAVEAARAVIRSRWPVQIAPNTAAAIARHAVEAVAPILLAAGRTEDPLLAELVRAAQTWRAQFYKPAESKPPRMAALIAAVDALEAARVAENGADRG